MGDATGGGKKVRPTPESKWKDKRPAPKPMTSATRDKKEIPKQELKWDHKKPSPKSRTSATRGSKSERPTGKKPPPKPRKAGAAGTKKRSFKPQPKNFRTGGSKKHPPRGKQGVKILL